MHLLQKAPLKHKLILFSLSTTLVALLFAGIVMGTKELIDLKHSLLQNITVQARIIGNNSAAALLFNDHDSIEDILSALSATPSILHAVIYDKNGRVFAEYLSKGQIEDPPLSPLQEKEGYRFEVNHLLLYQKIVFQKKTIGAIFIKSDLKKIYSSLLWHLLAGLGVISISFAGALLIFSRLQRTVTGPILDLLGLMRNISRDKDYSRRAQIESRDEIGLLSEGLNDMLLEIQKRDIDLEHQQKQLEDLVVKRTGELMRTKEQLEQELVERVRAEKDHKLVEGQLRHAQKMESVGQLAGGIAHDFNNILTAIMGYGDLLQTKLKDDNQARNYVDQILASAERAADLTQGLLVFSRKQVVSPKPVDVNGIMRKVENLLLRLIGEDIELKTVMSEDDLIIMADVSQIEQVLMNLATNARDAMPGGGSLTIKTGRMELDDAFLRAHGYGKPGRYALITVSDTGKGMDEETRERIFEPFYTTKEVGRGTGLGLAIVYGIIKQQEGYINVYSEQGKGTIFKIYFPLITLRVEQIRRTEPASPATAGSETVLIAEDNVHVMNVTREVLDKSGYTVIEAVDGEDAINKFIGHKDDIRLCILDMIMPKKNGMEACKEIRKMRPDIKVLFASGYTADIIQKKGIIEEGFEYIQKPISPNDFLREVRAILDK